MKYKKVLISTIIILISIFSLFISYHITLKELPKSLLELLLYSYKKPNYENFKFDFITFSIKNTYKKSFKNTEETFNNKLVYQEKEPIIYIYNTHPNEEYSYSKNNIYNIIPTVQTANNILKDELNKFGINSIIEKRNVTDYLNKENLPYSSSYKISRRFLEEKALENPNLEYFIDLHRDSVKRSITTIEINGISYARIMFLLGLENPNYEENKNLMLKLNTYLEENYKGISRGIYEKKGVGVNGIYNQDFNQNVFLIEVGGYENTIEEVANSLNVIAKCLNNYLNT